MIKKISIDGLLSFDKFELELRNLNVLIGPNGSGKSNLIEAFSLLQALPMDIGEPIRRGGGIDAWLTKLPRARAPVAPAAIRTSLEVPGYDGRRYVGLDYTLRLRGVAGRYEVAAESLDGLEPKPLDFAEGRGHILRAQSGEGAPELVEFDFRTKSGSVLQYLRDPDSYPFTEQVAKEFSGISLFRDISLGRLSPVRESQPADEPKRFLAEDSTNLALMVNEMENLGLAEEVEAEFRRFYHRLARFSVDIFANKVLLNMHEEGLSRPIPATRWSDGMIRYLCLLTILCHPEPPPLICIDEPELGFHPDVLPNLARLIKSCAERTQVIITTHSAELVDQFSDDPDAVVVCERDFDGATRMERVPGKRLEKWLKDYTLGDLWRRGEIGGNPP